MKYLQLARKRIITKMKRVFKFFWKCARALYFPVYILSWILHKFARLLLAISYFGMLEKTISKDILKYLFVWHGKH